MSNRIEEEKTRVRRQLAELKDAPQSSFQKMGLLMASYRKKLDQIPQEHRRPAEDLIESIEKLAGDLKTFSEDLVEAVVAHLAEYDRLYAKMEHVIEGASTPSEN